MTDIPPGPSQEGRPHGLDDPLPILRPPSHPPGAGAIWGWGFPEESCSGQKNRRPLKRAESL